MDDDEAVQQRIDARRYRWLREHTYIANIERKRSEERIDLVVVHGRTYKDGRKLDAEIDSATGIRR